MPEDSSVAKANAMNRVTTPISLTPTGLHSQTCCLSYSQNARSRAPIGIWPTCVRLQARAAHAERRLRARWGRPYTIPAKRYSGLGVEPRRSPQQSPRQNATSA